MAVYELMKDSKLPWIGAIPSHWHIIRIKELMQNVSEKNHPNATVLSLYREYGILPKDSRDDNHNVTSLDTASYKFVRIGELVINKMKAWQGSLGVSDYEGIVSPAYYVCRFTSDKINTKYFHYLIRCKVYAQEFERLSTGMRVGQWDLGIDDFMCTPAIIPPIDEQSAIASYLDDQCAKIDALISEAKASIEEYKQWKASLIFETVTRGLDPNVEMKDSGIDWIGNVPSTWKTNTLYQLVTQVKNKNTAMQEDNLLSLSYGKIKRRDINARGGLLPESFTGYNIIEKDDIVLRLTDLQNDHTSLRVGISKERGIITSAYTVLRAINQENAAYMHYLLHAFDIKKGFYGMGSGVRQGLKYDEVKELRIVLPPLTEQNDIVKYIDEKYSKIDSMIAEKETIIDKLDIYKKSLIYETVTGKRKVV